MVRSCVDQVALTLRVVALSGEKWSRRCRMRCKAPVQTFGSCLLSACHGLSATGVVCGYQILEHAPVLQEPRKPDPTLVASSWHACSCSKHGYPCIWHSPRTLSLRRLRSCTGALHCVIVKSSSQALRHGRHAYLCGPLCGA
jgi:hypothetical protein